MFFCSWKPLCLLILLVLCAAPVRSGGLDRLPVESPKRVVHVNTEAGFIELEMLAPNIFRIDVQPQGRRSPRTLVINPDFQLAAGPAFSLQNRGGATVIRSSRMSVSVENPGATRISITDSTGKGLVEQALPLMEAEAHSAVFLHSPDDNLYGMRGISVEGGSDSLLRNDGAIVAAGGQGDGGAPFFFTARYGVLIDSNGGAFETSRGKIAFKGDSRANIEYFVILGEPMEVISAVAQLTGLPPIPPKWTLGFLNSQWGSSETEIEQLMSTYRKKRIPIDAFILDADWKAWGEDNYGEFRWNRDRFPDGPSGKFAKDMQAAGIKLAGIVKPRVIVSKANSTAVHQAAQYAATHGLLYAEEPQYIDYLSKGTTRDIDFSNPDARSWFWKNLEPTFDTGMIGWWNDEADVTDLDDGTPLYFPNFQFLNMGRMIYEGQRAHSGLRVWSLNRNFYLGAQRYSYAEWSGDTNTGFESMQRERVRMLSTINLGEPHWSMDTGGFHGHPSPENYARWMEFAAFVPIFRVHGAFGEKRQPWVYGEKAEAAAVRVSRLRYSLLPYMYSYERTAAETGIGLVRPLFWAFPRDPRVANESSSWMFGDAFLVSPVVHPGASVQQLYLPEGTWYDYFRGTQCTGGRVIYHKVDPSTWQDIPLFVREGSIIASQDPQDYVDQHPSAEVTLDVFPGKNRSRFVYYDDDGTTYAYEHGVYYRQPITVSSTRGAIRLQFDSPKGSFAPALKAFLVRVHGSSATGVLVDGTPLARTAEDRLANSNRFAWANSSDRFGPVTVLRLAASRASAVTLTVQEQ